MTATDLILVSSLTPTNLAAVALPCVLAASPSVQGFPITATSGGTLAAGTYGYRVSALIGTSETLAAATITATTTSTTGMVTLYWLPVPGATSYKVYGRTSGSELLMATVAAPATSWVDTGSVTPAGALPTSSAFVEATAAPGLWTPPTGKTAQLSGLVVSNPTNNAGNVFLSVVHAGSTGGAANRVLGGNLSRPDAFAGVPDIDIVRSHVLAPGDFITGYATVPGLILTLDGVLSS
ncbi:hypothetical protein QN357_01405 [Cryobacterium sp. RTC2.1]|uniref:hypothetical protein n=1 Tax=Cryobacterium sp. RTC2.1 TaxID=3048634 RepID=UPI002B239936|nr:hypothetical protein [Cryobacterium sp. RTC2.1]MEB0001592.1 hypothetical protein [Cryobacterium sp. RTC2.1]